MILLAIFALAFLGAGGAVLYRVGTDESIKNREIAGGVSGLFILIGTAGLAWTIRASLLGPEELARRRHRRARQAVEAHRMVILEEMPSRLVIHVPSGNGTGKNTAAAAMMASIGTGLLLFFILLGSLSFHNSSNEAAPRLFFAVAIGFTAMLDLVFLWWWMRHRFESTTVRLNPGKITVEKRILFCRQRIRLNSDARAEVPIAYHLDNKPVHHVVINDSRQRIAIGGILPKRDQVQLAEKINRFLHHTPSN